MEYVTAIKKYASDAIIKYGTDGNISMGVSVILVLAGILHAVPGSTLKMQSKAMGMPQWFILCAGLLMVGSGALYYLKPLVGIYAVSLCMGGALATAASMPKPKERPGGMIISSLTVGAAFWANRTSVTIPAIGISTVAFVAGIAGRMYVMKHPEKVGLGFLANFLGKHLGSEKNASEKKNTSGSESKTEVKKTEGQKMPEKANETNKTGARKRAESPAPKSKPLSE